MILYCANCGKALVYNPAKNKMECPSCGSLFDAERTPEPEDTMECNIYTCTACGAELAINGVESSTFCAYCGQPTIIFSRVSSEIKPKYILPFSVTKDQAVIAIRQKLKRDSLFPMRSRTLMWNGYGESISRTGCLTFIMKIRSI